MRRELQSPLSALDVMFMRRSVRAYTAQRLDKTTLQGLLDAAVQAPTAMHEEPWALVVVQDLALLKRYSDVAKGNWAAEAKHYRHLHHGADAAAAAAFAERFASPDFCVFYDAHTLDRDLRETRRTLCRRGLLAGCRKPHARGVRARIGHVLHRIGDPGAEQSRHQIGTGNSRGR